MSITGQTHCDPCYRQKQGFVIVPEHRALYCVSLVSLLSYNGPNMATVKIGLGEPILFL